MPLATYNLPVWSLALFCLSGFAPDAPHVAAYKDLSKSQESEGTVSEFIWLVVPVKIERVPEDRGMPSAVLHGDVCYFPDAAMAWADARHQYINAEADVVLVYSWDVVAGLSLKGSVGRHRASTNIDFPGSVEYCDNFNRQVGVMAAAQHAIKAAMEAT